MPSAIAGAKAANEMQNVIQAYNDSLPPEREHFKIILNGIGLDCGIGVAVDREDKLHGEVSNTAYHIGEDLCSGGRVLFVVFFQTKQSTYNYFCLFTTKRFSAIL